MPAEGASPGRRVSPLPAGVHSPAARTRAARLARLWSAAPGVSAESLAWGLRAAYSVDDHHRRGRSVELVWTGPVARGTTLRRTDQVLLDLVRTAERTLHVVTFAAYRIPAVKEAMLAAAKRGVAVTLIFESPDASAGKTAFAGLGAVGEELKELSEVYLWPLEKRPKDSAGKHGSLHAKCAVADEEALFVSSANLTEYALNLNMEMGLLVRGGDLPGRAVGHLRGLAEEGILVPI
ncbi:MAG: DISARM system phospholipase D-like protein DrmC [Actinomycetota bacterium]|nr:DISARM system phospholipase D-like protein DrmC [Actinomycetota bacterium]